jgi:salicylate hydroxylase
MLKETGALISLQPNASKIVSSWGLAPFLDPCEPMVDTAFRMVDASGKLVRQLDLDFARFGADRVLYHRQDLHTALKTAATSPDLPGRPVEIRTASRVTACDPDEGTVTLDGGETLDADIVIGADGIHSVVREAVVGEPREAVPTGTSAYRMLLPAEALAGLDIPKDVLDIARPVTTMVVGHDRRIVMGPGRGGKVFGIVALVPDEHMRETSTADSWVTKGSPSALLEAFAGFPAWLLAIFERGAADAALWQLRDVDPLPRWVRGRAILVGDAAHAMLPTQGQGASQSFEDAEALQAFLADLSSDSAGGRPTREQVNAALLRVFEARHERASLIQRYSREQAKPGTEAGSDKIKLDPGQFMEYNCKYSGAKDWLARKGLDTAVEKLSVGGS